MVFMVSRLEVCVERFRELSRLYRHLSRRASVIERTMYAQAQVEMYYLAQAITTMVDPALQLELDDIRRQIVEQLELHIKVPTGARVETMKVRTTIMWSDFQLTPEMAVDPTITGNAVLFPLLKRLKVLLRIQVSTVTRLVYGRL